MKNLSLIFFLLISILGLYVIIDIHGVWIDLIIIGVIIIISFRSNKNI